MLLITTLLFPLATICNRGVAKQKVIQKQVSLSRHTLYKNEGADSGFLLSAVCIDSSKHIILRVIQYLVLIAKAILHPVLPVLQLFQPFDPHYKGYTFV